MHVCVCMYHSWHPGNWLPLSRAENDAKRKKRRKIEKTNHKNKRKNSPKRPV